MRTKALAAFAAGALALSTCATTGAPRGQGFPVWERTLPSGMRVVVEQDATAGIAGVVLIVDVGAADNPADKPGLAHTLEHLVFRAPDDRGLSMATRLGQHGAASYNAMTGVERTTYLAFAPSRSLDEIVASLLARLADPLRGATDALLAKEASIVAEELRMKEGASGTEVLMPALLPPGHPHARAFASWRQTAPLSLADVRAFAARYYRPERMTLVISGPITAEWRAALWDKIPAALHGGESERRAPVRREQAAFAGPARADGDLQIARARVDGPELWMGWRLPPAQGVAAKKLGMIARVAGQVLSGRLLGDPADAIDVDVWAMPGNLSSALICRIKLRSSADAVPVRDAAKAAIGALSDGTRMAYREHLWSGYAQAVQEATIRTTVEMESMINRSLTRAELVHAGGTALISEVFDALARTTVAQVSEFATSHLRGEASRAVLLISDRSERVTLSAPGAQAAPSASVPGVQVDAERELGPEPGAGDGGLPPPAALTEIAQTPGARAARVHTLKNGLTVIALRRPGLPFVAMQLGFHADPQPGDAPGARHAIDTSLRWDLPVGPLERGVLRGIERTPDSLRESLTMLSRNAGQALDLLADEADSVQLAWPNPRFDRWTDVAARVEATADDRALRAFRTALLGDHAYNLRPTVNEIRNVTGPEAERWLARVRRPANGALVIVGDIDQEAVVRNADSGLRGWHGDASPPPPPPAPPVAPPSPPAGLTPSIVHVEDPHRASVALRFGCVLPPVRSPRDAIVHDMLASLIQGELHDRLRLKLAVSYAPNVGAFALRGGTAWLEGKVDVDGRSASQAMGIAGAWFDRAQPFTIEPRGFERLRLHKARGSALANDTNDEIARAIFEAWNMGWAPAVLDDFPRDLAAITVDDVAAALRTCRARSVITVLAAAPITYN